MASRDQEGSRAARVACCTSVSSDPLIARSSAFEVPPPPPPPPEDESSSSALPPICAHTNPPSRQQPACPSHATVQRPRTV
eukprot:1173021-Rhodomonas_salina.1